MSEQASQGSFREEGLDITWAWGDIGNADWSEAVEGHKQRLICMQFVACISPKDSKKSERQLR